MPFTFIANESLYNPVVKIFAIHPFPSHPRKKNRWEISNLNSLHKLSAEAETVKRERRVFAPNALQYLLTRLNNRHLKYVL